MRPRDLPKVRDQTIQYLDDPESSMRVNLSADIQPGLDAARLHLSQAAMFWVKPSMAALAVSAGSQLDEAGWDLPSRPAAAGLLMFEGGIGQMDSGGVPTPIDGCVWGTHEGECLIWLLMLRSTLMERTANLPYSLDIQGIPALIPVVSYLLETNEPQPTSDMDEERTVLSALAAAWMLMEQPTLVDRTIERPDKLVRRAYARAERPAPEVSLVDLRRAYVPQDSDRDADGDGRQYRHRWVVSGHWRNQAYGPERALRRRQWIPSYVKGPDGAPLLGTEKVNVWRR